MSKSVVITGSTRGIGFCLADEFLVRGCSVTICGRTQQAVDKAGAKLGEKYGKQLVCAVVCDVTDYSQVENLYKTAKQQFGKVDIWINNAGITAPMVNFWELPTSHFDDVVRTNIIGTMYGTKVAVEGMLAQGNGSIYNMEGYGARRNRMHGAALYGTTKAGIHFFDQSLAEEVEGTGLITGAIAPGMVITDMVTQQFIGREAELARSKRILNIIAERPETVAPVLVRKILDNKKNGVTIAYAPRTRLILKFLLAPFNKRDLFAQEDPGTTAAG